MISLLCRLSVTSKHAAVPVARTELPGELLMLAVQRENSELPLYGKIGC